MNDAGRIGFVLKGEYEDTATYDFLDVVYYDGASYVAKKLTIGNVPQESDEYWQIFAKNISDIDELEESVANIETWKGSTQQWLNILDNRLTAAEESIEDMVSPMQKAVATIKIGNGLVVDLNVGELIDRRQVGTYNLQVDSEEAYTQGSITLMEQPNSNLLSECTILIIIRLEAEEYYEEEGTVTNLLATTSDTYILHRPASISRALSIYYELATSWNNRSSYNKRQTTTVTAIRIL